VEIQRLRNQEKDFEDEKDKYTDKIAYSRNSKDRAEKELKDIEKKEVKISNDSEKASKLKRKLDFCKDAIVASKSLELKLFSGCGVMPDVVTW
jgi:chromosome segregation ATPase